ncbi:MAG: hypothetical protein R2830_08390 [Saprospiraceae bacterium]
MLKSLSAEEIRQLDKFVRSPVHNQHNDVVALFQYIRKYLNGGQRALQKEQVYGHLYPGEPFNMQKVHYVSSYLLKVVEEFLAWRAWRNNEGNFYLYLMKSYHEHHQESLFDAATEKMQNTLANSDLQDVNFLFQTYQLELERFNYKRTQSKTNEFRLQELSDSQDIAFMAEKLRNACILLSNQSVSKTSYDIGLLDKFLPSMANHPYLEIPAISIYYFAIKTLTHQQDDHSFQKLKSLLRTHQLSFTKGELYDMYIFAINYCIRRYNSGDLEFMKEAFEIYKIGMVVEAFVQNGTITPRTYSNIVMSGLRFNEFDWVEQFIFLYKNSLPEKQREGFFNYNLARFYYEQRDYKKAMPLLLQMEYDDVLLTCSGKILQIKMYLEQKEMETLSSSLQSFKIYLKRKKMLGYHKESYINFIFLVGKIMQLKTNETMISLQKEITETKVVAEKEWLLAQLGN